MVRVEGGDDGAGGVLGGGEIVDGGNAGCAGEMVFSTTFGLEKEAERVDDGRLAKDGRF